MLSKNIAFMCILMLGISFLVLTISLVNAHQAPDPGPSIIEGDIANMNNDIFIDVLYLSNTWSIYDSASDSQGNTMLVASVGLVKRRYYDENGVAYSTGGTAHASVKAVATVSGFPTHGDYYVKGKARGLLWYRSEKKSSSYRNGTYKSASKSAVRNASHPTWSDVHLWEKQKSIINSMK